MTFGAGESLLKVFLETRHAIAPFGRSPPPPGGVCLPLWNQLHTAFGGLLACNDMAVEERHQIMQWYDAFCAFQKKHRTKPKGEIEGAPINGLVSAYFGLAYNLYLLQHNAELQAYLIRRLKQKDCFYAAYYETYVAAWFILAGFKLKIENEEDSTQTHAEFIATKEGRNYSVEAKTRTPRKPHFDVANQLYKALIIEAKHPRIVFIDMNVGADIDPE